jgi:transposase
VEEAKCSLGKFIVATNELEVQNLPAAAMLENYAAQGVSIERGFRFLKDPMFFAHSLFLKNPARIIALIMIMGLALLIFALGERQLRQALKQNNKTIPDQKGKPTQTPTLRWVFQIFEGLDVLSVWEDGRLVTRKMLNLRPVHQHIIRLLGPQIQKCYLVET